MTVFDEIAQYILDTHNGQGKKLTQDIHGMSHGADTMSIFYANYDTAVRVAEEIGNKFSIVTTIVNDPDGIVFVLVVPDDHYITTA
jgi:hypothetical protein